MATTLPPAPESPTGETEAPRAFSRLRARALVTGFLLAFPAAYATTNQTSSSMFSLMVAPISVLLLVLFVNFFLRKLLPRLAFTQTDLIAMYAIVTVVCATAGEWTNVVSSLIYFPATQVKTNATYRDYVVPQMPDAMTVKDEDKVKDIYGGGKDWQYATDKFVNLYLPKTIPWLVLVGAMLIAMQCVNSLMRGAWCQRERLSFPLIQMPVAMCEDGGGGGMWRSRYMWIAFAVMFGIEMLNGFNYLYPNLPSIPVKDLFMVNQAFKDPPLSNMGDVHISIFPFMAAIGLFMPSDMLFSFVVFYLLRVLTHIVLAANGISQETFSGSGILPGPPYFDEQTWGAVFALFLGAVWVSRGYLKGLWRDILRFSPSEDGGVRHTWSFLGLLACTAVVVWFGVHFGTLPVFYTTIYFIAFMMFSVVLTRVRAQLGPPTHEFAYFGVNTMFGRFFGNRWLTDKQATWCTTGYLMMNRIYRNHPMPVQLEAEKMGQMERLKPKPMFSIIAIASLLGMFLCFYYGILGTYRTGALGYVDTSGFLEKIVNDRHGPDVVGIVMTIFGFAMVMILDALRFRFPGFALHPAGYFLSMNFGVDYYWFGLLIALIVKNFVQRYYGLSGYEKLRAVALGILLGEYTAETIWMVMAIITKQSTYTIGFNDRSLGTQ
ncbi:MAG TPA: DUF6785 family protein [Fimbriimonas sp.]|nr:DUF6785 family protein [Fimbriimonas sp.]